jgi:hypothetical protein
MSKSTFKGAISAGQVGAKFASDHTNADSDLLVVSYAATGGGNAKVNQAVSVPGGVARANVSTDQAGVLEVWVVIGHESDKGRLTVTLNGNPLDEDDVQGSVRWVYAVEAP